ncbi:MAG TPA: sulfatase-like hydrolase/transferase, partial [Actinomycetota bacterium]|nr:sulfatase-like hydrolase/transferase [Actinomycetota bacterium]
MRHVTAIALGALLVLVPADPAARASTAIAPVSAGSERAAPPDIVLIVTDDQRWDTLWAMPILSERLAGAGVTFPDAFVVNPLCCPSRASILTGDYSHT